MRQHTSAILTVLLALTVVLWLSGEARAQTYEIYTYGNGPILNAVFEGISTFTGPGGGLAGALKLAALIGLLGLLVSMIGTTLGGGRAIASLPIAAIVAGTVATMSTSTATVAIVDKVGQTSEIIQRIPLPIALIGHFTSAVGSRITEQIEQVILPVDVERFMSHGLGWGPRVAQATLEAQIQDPNLRQDLDSYIQVCVSENFNSGNKTAKDLTQGTTVEKVLGDTNPAIPFILPSQQQNPPQNQTCLDAWNNILSLALEEHATSQNVLQFMAMRLNLPSYTDVLPAITDISQDLLKVSQSATELLKLRFAVNQLLPSLQAMSAVGGQSAMVTAWALAEAQAQQTSGWLTTGLMLQQVLPVFHAALEFLFYGFLLIGIPLLMVMPRMITKILATALWLQLWPVAYVFGNLFLYTQVSQVSQLTGDTTQGLGWSLAATPAITSSIQSAYAASGFPIMIGVMLLGSMIFGGEYMTQRAVMQGPWQAGGGFGTAAALGNVSVGNVGYEQRQLAPQTQMERDGGIDTIYGQVNSPALIQRRGGSFTEIGTSAGRIIEAGPVNGDGGSFEAQLGGGVQFAATPEGRVQSATLPVSAQTSESVTTQGGNALSVVGAESRERRSALEDSKSSHFDQLMQTTASMEASSQHGISESTRSAFEQRKQRAVEDVLTSGKAGEEFRRHVIDKNAEAGLGAGVGAAISGFSLGADGKMNIHAQFQNGETTRTTLGQEATSKVLSEAHESLGQTTEYQHLQQEVERHGKTSMDALGFTDVQRSTEAYSEATKRQTSVETSVRAVQDFTARVGSDQAGPVLQGLWDARHPGVNIKEAFKHDTDDAKSFAAFLRTSLSNSEGLRGLAQEYQQHMQKTGHFDSHAAQSQYIKDQDPSGSPQTRPSSRGITPVENPLPNTGNVQPARPLIGPIRDAVSEKQEAAAVALGGEKQALDVAGRRRSGGPTSEPINRGIDTLEQKTHGGALTAAGQVAGEVVSGVKDTVVGVGTQLGAAYRAVMEEQSKVAPEGYNFPTP